MSVGLDSMVILEFKRRTSKAWHHLRSGRKDLQKSTGKREIITIAVSPRSGMKVAIVCANKSDAAAKRREVFQAWQA